MIEEADPGVVYDSHHHRAWRRQQLGWVGAALCMLHLRKPSMVSEDVPVGVNRGHRRRSRRSEIVTS